MYGIQYREPIQCIHQSVGPPEVAVLDRYLHCKMRTYN